MRSNSRWLVLGLVSCALFLIVVDMTVLYTALPRLTHDLGASASEKLWIVNIYSLVVAGLLPGFGTLGDRLGSKPLFVSGLLVFGIASLAAAFSLSPAALIGARILLAVGGAMMMPATLAILRNTFEDAHEQALAIGVWASVASGGAAFGPVIGGILLEHFWWGSVFLINVPIVIVLLPLTLSLIPHNGGNKSVPWDFLGSIQIMIGLIGVTYAVKEIARREPDYGLALAVGLMGIMFIVLFVRRQRRARQPLIDFALFRNNRFSAGVIAALMAAMAIAGIQLLFSQWLQLVRSMSPLDTGLFNLPIALASFFVGPVAGWLLLRMGMQRTMCYALFVSGVSVAAFALLLQAAPVWQLSCLAVFGAGMGATMTAASGAIMLNAPASRAGMAASVEEVSYELGGALGVALLGSFQAFIYTTALILPASLAVSPTVRDSLDEALIAAEGLLPDAAAGLVMAARSAFETAFVIILAVTAGLLVCAALLVRWMGRSDMRQQME